MRTTQTSLFRKYMTITMCILFASYVVLGSIMMAFMGKFWKDEKAESLTSCASGVSEMISNIVHLTDETGILSAKDNYLPFFLEKFTEKFGVDLFITDNNGEILIDNYSYSGLCGDNYPVVDASVVRSVQESEDGFSEFHSTFDCYPTKYYAVGVPLYYKDVETAHNDEAVGAVFAATSSDSYVAYQSAVIKVFLISSLISFIISFFVVWAFTYKMTQPLRQMSQAARAFGNGDFSIRVPADRNDEIGELGLAFNNMANSLSNSEEMRRSFIANVSHELKTPMTTIAGFIDGILDGTIPKDKESQYLGVVSDEIKRLSRLVRSMLDLSKIDAGELKLTPVRFDLADTLFQTLLTFEQVINEKGIEIRGLETIAPLNIVGDQDLLHQVIYNLIENAVKFTNPDGYIKIGLTDCIDRAVVSIENSGIGINAEELPKVFERFYKTDRSRSRDKNGMGLGLYLCRTIIKLHGGDISVSSVENQYCRFDFYLPKHVNNQKTASGVINLGGNMDDDIQDVE
ncbi:MAG: HAMP domain-containing sensor histidine kinase [Clostridia bacterium]|nr:HAMP domain-containing sensor histidine kinase [Clostridia bacterium]